MFIFDFINENILSHVLRFIMSFCNNNFAVTIVVFTLFINALLIPLSIKSQKTSVQQIKIRPKLEELKRKYGDDRQKFAMAQQQLYQDEKVSMSGGCLPMIIRLVFLMSIFYLITKPLSYLTGLSADVINTATEGVKAIMANSAYSPEISVLNFIRDESLMAGVTDEGLKSALAAVQAEAGMINFNLFGISLTETPVFSFDFIHEAKPIWIIPILSGVTALLSGILSSKLQKAMNPDAPNMMAMNLIMPIFSMFIAFKAPGGLGFYWACSSLVSSLVQAGVQYFYSPYKMIAKEREKSILSVFEQEKKLINK